MILIFLSPATQAEKGVGQDRDLFSGLNSGLSAGTLLMAVYSAV